MSKRIIIIPYRNRKEHKEVFINHMQYILEPEIEILFIHQKDERPFNRGAIKNIGFLYVKNTYPAIYKDITLIFHDIDYMPYKKDIIPYDTKSGEISHFFGFKFALGGIFAIKGGDFEKIRGFPNYWGWGFEDNRILDKWKEINGVMNYEHFHDIKNRNIIRLHNTFDRRRIWNKKNVDYLKTDKPHSSGFDTLKKVEYTTEELPNNVKMVHVNNFLTERKHDEQKYTLSLPPKKLRARKISLMSEILQSQR